MHGQKMRSMIENQLSQNVSVYWIGFKIKEIKRNNKLLFKLFLFFHIFVIICQCKHFYKEKII